MYTIYCIIQNKKNKNPKKNRDFFGEYFLKKIFSIEEFKKTLKNKCLKKNFFYCLKKHVIKKIIFLSCFRVRNFLFEKAKKTTVFSIVHTIHATISNQKWGSLLAVTLMLFGASWACIYWQYFNCYQGPVVDSSQLQHSSFRIFLGASSYFNPEMTF